MRRIAALFLCLLTSSSAFAQQIPAAIASDPAPDKAFPAEMQAPDIMSHGARLNAVLYMASGAGPHPTVLLLHGFPGNEQNMDLAYAIRRAGWNALVPHYRGSWGSQGDFSFSNAIADTQASIEFLLNPANDRQYRIDPAHIVLVGHSMGGFLAAYSASQTPQVVGIAMIAAWNIGPSVARAAPSGSKLFEEASPRLAGTTPRGLQEEARTNAALWNYVSYASALKNRPVLIVEAADNTTDDNKQMAAALRKEHDLHLSETFIQADHAFSDHRIALESAILNWLQQFEQH